MPGQGRGIALRPLSRDVPSFAALLLILCVLLIFNFSAWRLLQLLKESKEKDLEERLRYVAQNVARDLKQPAPPLILSFIDGRPADEQAQMLGEFGATQIYDQLKQRLVALQAFNDLARIDLLSPSGLVVVSSESERPGDSYVFSDLDRVQLEEAVAGRFGNSRLYYIDKKPFKRLYYPFTNESQILGVLQVSVSADYLAEMQGLSRRVRVQSLVSSLLLLLIGMSIYRLFVHLVRAEKMAMQGERVEAMGTLAGGLAHELRNPLSIIRMMSEEIVSEQPEGSRSEQNARDIIAEIERLNDMVSHFLSLSRSPEGAQARTLDLREELERVVQLVRKSSPSRVRFTSELPARPLLVRGDERALRQLFLNLLINAREACEAGQGEVRVSLRERRAGAELHISDNGCGIATRDLNRIFEPFYTTKDMGTGLGLSISRSIVENMGGSLSISSTPGKGTTVQLFLPLAAARSEAAQPQSI